MKALRRTSVVAVIAASIVATIAAPAWAPRNLFHSGTDGSCVFRDSATTFSGAFDVRGFTAEGDQLMVVGALSGSCAIPDAEKPDTLVVNDPAATTEATITLATCNEFFFTLGTYETESATVDLTKEEVQLFVFDPLLDEKQVGKQLCVIAKTLDKRGAEQLAAALNRVLLDI